MATTPTKSEDLTYAGWQHSGPRFEFRLAEHMNDGLEQSVDNQDVDSANLQEMREMASPGSRLNFTAVQKNKAGTSNADIKLLGRGLLARTIRDEDL